MRFYEALPRHKAELVNGQMYLGGSLRKSAMAMGYMIEHLGAAYVAEMVDKALLSDAIIVVFGENKGQFQQMADFSPVKPFYNAPAKLSNDLRMGLFMKDACAWGGGMAVKLGENVFTPDVYLLTKSSAHRQNEYYFDGPPDLIMEIMVPVSRSFDQGLRLQHYAEAGVPEVWLIDFERRTFHPIALQNGQYVEMMVDAAIFHSIAITGFSVEHHKIFDSLKTFGMEPLSIFQLPEALLQSKPLFSRAGSFVPVPFAPRFDLNPVAITHEEFLSWGGEVKFEMMDGRPVFGGSEETTREWLALLIMTLGLEEAVKYLPAEEWAGVI
jgi:Putative restriction endonuclease